MIQGTGFLPGEQVTGVIHSQPFSFGPATADANGTVTFTVTLPDTFELGMHAIELVGAATGAVTLPTSDFAVVPTIASGKPALQQNAPALKLPAGTSTPAATGSGPRYGTDI